MRDILVSSGGVKAGRVPQEHAMLECAPVVVIGGCGYRDPLGVPEGQCEPAEGLFLLDTVPLSGGARVALLTEAPMSTPPAVLAATSLLGSVVLIEGSELHCALTLRQYLRRLTVLHTGDITAAPATERDNLAARGSEGGTLAKAACEEAAALAQTLPRLQRDWPCPMPMLRVIVVESPGAPSRNGPLEQPTLPCVMAGTTAPEIDSLLRAAGEGLFSSVVITRCRDNDAGSVTHDVVTHAPPKRLGPSMRPLIANGWLALVADAYGRVQGWRHITGRSTIATLCERVNGAVDDAIGASNFHHGHSHIHTGGATNSSATVNRQQQQGGPGSRHATAAVSGANASMTSIPQLNGSDATLVADADEVFGDLLRMLDGVKRRVGPDGAADSRAQLEAGLLQVLRPHWHAISRYAVSAAAAATAGGAAGMDASRAAELDEALRVADEWIPAVAEDVAKWRDEAIESTIAGNATRPAVNAVLVAVLLQWALPNAAAVTRTAVSAAAQIAQRKVDEVRRRSAAFEARAATAEAKVAELLGLLEESERRNAAEASNHAAATASGGASAGAMEAAAKQVEVDCARRLHQASQRAEALDRKVAQVAAAVAEEGAFWRRRHASSEFLATNYSGVGNSKSQSTPPRPAAFATSFMAGLNRTAAAGSDASPQRRAPQPTVDDGAMKAEIAQCYEGISALTDKIARFADEYTKAAASSAGLQPLTFGAAAHQHLASATMPPGLDASSIRDSRRPSVADGDDVGNATAFDGVRAARLAAVANTFVGKPHTPGHGAAALSAAPLPVAPSPPRETDPNGPAVRVPVGTERPADGLVPLREGSASGSPRRGPGDDADFATGEVTALRSALERATSTLAELQTQFEARGDAVDRAADVENDLRSQLESARATATRLMQDNDVLRAEMKRMLRDAANADALQDELDAAQYQLRAQSTTAEAFGNENKRMHQAILDANENRNGLERDIAEARAELRACRETSDANAERIRDLEQELYAATSARQLAENNVDSLQTELKVLKAEFDELEIESRELRTRNTDLVAQSNRDSDASHARIESLQSELASTRAELETTRAAAGNAESEQEAAIERLTRKSHELQNQLELAVSREHQAHSAQSNVYSDLTNVLVERDALKASLADHEKRVERAAKSLSLLRDENVSLKHRLSSGSPARLSALSAGNGSGRQSRHVSPEPWRLAPAGNVSSGNVNISLGTYGDGPGAAAAYHVRRDTHMTSHNASYNHDLRHATSSAPRPLPSIAEELLRGSNDSSN